MKNKVFGLMLLGIAMPAKSIELAILEWEGYISSFKQNFEAYAISQGKDITLTIAEDLDNEPVYITNFDDMFHILRSSKADIVTPTSSFYNREGGRLYNILVPIDRSRLSNVASLPNSLSESMYDLRDEKHFSVPLIGGSYGLAYNASYVAAPSSWEVLSAPENKGKVSMTDKLVEANGYIAAIMAGTNPKDVYDQKNVDYDKTLKVLQSMRGNTIRYWGGMAMPADMKNWHYITTYGFGVAAANNEGQDWKMVIPKEGQTLWLDTIAISSSIRDDKEKLEAAYFLIDYMLSGEVQAEMTRIFGSVPVVTNAKEHWSSEEQQRFNVQSDEFYIDGNLWQALDKRTSNFYELLWNQAGK